MKNTISFVAGAIMFLIPALSGAQALPYTVADVDPAILAKGGTALTETGSVSHAAFTNAAAVPFYDSTFDVSAGYVMWQPSAVNSNIINVGVAYNMNGKFGVAGGLYYGMNQEYKSQDGSFRPSDVHAALGISYRFLDFMSVGLNFGYATSTFAKGQSYGSFAGDAFLMAKIDDFKLTAGVSNVLGKIESAGGNVFKLPASAALGVGYATELADKHAIDAAIDFDYYFSGEIAASVGAEYTFNNMVSGRVGYRYGGESPIPSYASVGVGGKYMGIKLDVAYLIAGSDSPMRNTLAIGLGYSF